MLDPKAETTVVEAEEYDISSSDSYVTDDEVSAYFGSSQSVSEHSATGVFHRFLIWLLLILVITSIWHIRSLAEELSHLDTKLAHYETSLNWLEESQAKYKKQLRGDLSQSQVQFEKLRSNLEFGGLYGKEMNLKVRVGELDSRMNELQRQLNTGLVSKNSKAKLSTQNKPNTIEGKWAINLRSFDETENSAMEMLDKLKQAGVPASIQSVRVSGKLWKRVYISGFGTYEDARQYAEDVLVKNGIKKYWIRLKSPK